MPQNTPAPAERPAHASRPSASRKLLARKAADRVGPPLPGEALEDSFPAHDGAEAAVGSAHYTTVAAPSAVVANAQVAGPAGPLASPMAGQPAPAVAQPTPESAPLGTTTPAPTQPPAAPLAWSSEDESTLQALLARRRAAGFRRRGRDVAAQALQLGDIAPNAGTVVATIVALVRDAGGRMPRGELLDRMAAAAFASPHAKPHNRGWSQGWVAGALRDGFLALAPAAPASPVVPA